MQMTFLRKHGYSAVGFTFLVSVMTIELTMLLYPVIAMVHKNDFHTIDVDVTLIIEGLFASAAVMISFGALLGKVSPGQMLFLALAEVVFYCLNIWVGEVELKVRPPRVDRWHESAASVMWHMRNARCAAGCGHGWQYLHPHL